MAEDLIKSTETELKSIKREIRERTTGYVMAAFGFVLGLAWNDAVKSLIETYIPIQKNSAFTKLIYAAVLTTLFVIITYYINRWFSQNNENQQ
jgi:hypothetical protein